MNLITLRLTRALVFLTDLFIAGLWPIIKYSLCILAAFAVLVILFFLIAVF